MRQAFSIQDTVPAICEFIRTPSCVLISRVCRTNRGDYTDSINLVDVQKSLHCRDVIRIYATQINEKDWFTIRKRVKKDRLKKWGSRKQSFVQHNCAHESLVIYISILSISNVLQNLNQNFFFQVTTISHYQKFVVWKWYVDRHNKLCVFISLPLLVSI